MKRKNDSLETICREIGEECLGARVRLLNRIITSLYNDSLRPLGITSNQLNILISLEGKGFSTPGELSRFLQMEKSTLSRNLERMRKHGWIEVQAGTDARSRRLRVTPKGKSLIQKSWPLWKSAQDKAKKTMGEFGVASIRETANDIWAQQPGN